MRRLAAAFFACCLLTSMTYATGAQSLPGSWSGMLDFPSAQLLFVITIADGSSGLSATAKSPYQSGQSIRVDSISASNGNVSFAIAKLGITFTGVISANAISGTFTQRGISVPLVLTPSSIGTSDLAGTWLGTLSTPGGDLLLAIHVEDAPAGSLRGSMDSPSQHGFSIPITISRANGTLTFAIPSVGASYTGNIGANAITGTFTQNGASLPLTLTRPTSSTPAVALATPYPTPSPHFSSRDVTFGSGDAVLVGTLTVPNGPLGRMPAFVFVHGSGPATRDGGVPQNPTFLDLSNALSNAGVVVLRYDKRGIGASTGTATEDFHVLGDDARAAVAFLRAQPNVDPDRLFLLGHSEGGIVVPLVAPSIDRLAGVVLMAPPAIPMQRILDEQSARMTPALEQAVRKGFASDMPSVSHTLPCGRVPVGVDIQIPLCRHSNRRMTQTLADDFQGHAVCRQLGGVCIREIVQAHRFNTSALRQVFERRRVVPRLGERAVRSSEHLDRRLCTHCRELCGPVAAALGTPPKSLSAVPVPKGARVAMEGSDGIARADLRRMAAFAAVVPGIGPRRRCKLMATRTIDEER